MLAVAVRFLTGRYYASEFRDRTAPELVPHPDRLFSALVAAHHAGGAAPQEREALLWLQGLAPPALAAPAAVAPRSLHAMVPINDPYTDKRMLRPNELILPEVRNRNGRKPRDFPSSEVPGGSVHFIWADASPPPEIREAIGSLVARVPRLGAASSLVTMDLVTDPPPPTLVPDPAGAVVLRVPAPGRLEDLEAWFAAGLRPKPGRQVRYGIAGGAGAGRALPVAAFGELIAVSVEGSVTPDVSWALPLAVSLRRALLACADEPVTPLLHGHGGTPHAAYVALPFVGSRYADDPARVLGLGIWLPPHASDGDQRAVLIALARLAREGLRTPNPLGMFRVRPAGSEGAAPQTLQRRRWACAARVWASVTPVVFDRFPKPGKAGADAGAVMGAGCAAIGLPQPVEVDISGFSGITGVPPARAFHTAPDSFHGRRYIAHVRLRFAEPVRGPILLGAGRHFGMGLFAPLAENGADESVRTHDDAVGGADR